jgi:hypothetical protein
MTNNTNSLAFAPRVYSRLFTNRNPTCTSLTSFLVLILPVVALIIVFLTVVFPSDRCVTLTPIEIARHATLIQIENVFSEIHHVNCTVLRARRSLVSESQLYALCGPYRALDLEPEPFSRIPFVFHVIYTETEISQFQTFS